jgi:WD40 repeat protein
MELVPGGRTLRGFLDNERVVSPARGYYSKVALFVERLCRALQCAHDAGVIHRDLKPANVLIGSDDLPKVADFGVATLADERTLVNPGEVVGTPFYMSPEQVTAKRIDVDHRTDIFSVGVILYEMLTFSRPFEGDTPSQVAEKVMFLDPPSPQSLRSKVPLDLSIICLKAIEKRRADRYSGASELAEDLGRYLRDEPILAKPAGPIRRSRKWMQRHPVASVSGAIAASAFTIILSLLLLVRTEQRRADLNAAEADRALVLAEQRLVSNYRGRAMELWEQGQPGRALSWLVAALSTLDSGSDREHPLRVGIGLALRTVSIPETVLLHDSPVRFAALSPDGIHVLTAADERMRLWNTRTGESVRDFDGNGEVRAAALGPSGQSIAAIGNDALLWKTRTDDSPTVLPHVGAAWVGFATDSLAVTVDRRRVAHGWSVEDGRFVGQLTSESDALYSMSTHNSNALALVREGQRVSVKEVPELKSEMINPRLLRLVSSDSKDRLELRSDNWNVSLHPKGTHLFVGTGAGVTLWRTPQDRWERLWSTEGSFGRFSPDGGWMIVGSGFDSELRKVIKERGENARGLWGGAGSVSFEFDSEIRVFVPSTPSLGQAFSADGLRVITIAANGIVPVWRVEGEPTRAPIRIPGYTEYARFSGDGSRVLTADREEIRVWNARSGESEFKVQQTSVFGAEPAIDHTGSMVVFVEKRPDSPVPRLVHWSVGKGRKFFPIEELSSTSRVRLGRKGRNVVVIERFGSAPAALWRLDTGTTTAPVHDRVQSAEFNSDGSLFVTGGRDGTARIWDVEAAQSAAPVLVHGATVNAVAFSLDSSLVATAGHDYTAKIWDARTGEQLGPPLQHRDVVVSAAFSPDGKRLITASHDGTARIWTIASGDLAIAPLDHGAPVEYAEFSRDGRIAITAGNDRSARIWDVASGDPISPPFVHPHPVDHASINADGSRLLTVSGGVARLWNIEPDRRSRDFLKAYAEIASGRVLGPQNEPRRINADQLAESVHKVRSETAISVGDGRDNKDRGVARTTN